MELLVSASTCALHSESRAVVSPDQGFASQFCEISFCHPNSTLSRVCLPLLCSNDVSLGEVRTCVYSHHTNSWIDSACRSCCQVGFPLPSSSCQTRRFSYLQSMFLFPAPYLPLISFTKVATCLETLTRFPFLCFLRFLRCSSTIRLSQKRWFLAPFSSNRFQSNATVSSG